jgi:hypothetical protein
MTLATMTPELRLFACSLIRKRFAGRVELERRARSGGLVSLAKLEIELGLATELDLAKAYFETNRRVLAAVFPDDPTTDKLLSITDPASYDAAVARGYATRRFNDVDRAFWHTASPELCRAMDAKRAARKAWRDDDELASRPERHAEREVVKARGRELARRFRESMYGFSRIVHAVTDSDGFARSDTHQQSARSVELSRAYQSKASFVTCATHTWQFSRAILTAEVRALNDAAQEYDACVYLTATLRVRQGRGTSLVTERKTERGAWK